MMYIIRCNDNNISFNSIQMALANITCVGSIVEIHFLVIFDDVKVQYYNIYIPIFKT